MDLIVYLPQHGYSDDDEIFVSWLGGNYFVSDSDADTFKLATESGGSSLVQFGDIITEGYVQKVDSAGTTTIGGLDHLEGELVQVTADGDFVGSFVVSSGEITLPSTVYTYQVGLPYVTKIRSMRLAVPSQETTVQSRIKRISELVIRHVRSKGGRAGQEYNGREYLQRLAVDYSSDSGDTTILPQGGFNEDAYITVKIETPTPFTLLSTIVSVEVEETR